MPINHEELEKLKKMKDEGLLTEEEYRSLSSKVLNDTSDTYSSTNQNIGEAPNMNHLIAGVLMSGIANFILGIIIVIKSFSLVSNIDTYYYYDYLDKIDLGVGTIIMMIFMNLVSLAGHIVAIVGLNRIKHNFNYDIQKGLDKIKLAIILYVLAPVIAVIIILIAVVFASQQYTYDTTIGIVFVVFILLLMIGLIIFGYIKLFSGLAIIKRNLSNPTGIGFILAHFIIGLCSFFVGFLLPLAQLVGFILLIVGIFQIKSSFEKPSYNQY